MALSINRQYFWTVGKVTDFTLKKYSFCKIGCRTACRLDWNQNWCIMACIHSCAANLVCCRFTSSL